MSCTTASGDCASQRYVLLCSSVLLVPLRLHTPLIRPSVRVGQVRADTDNADPPIRWRRDAKKKTEVDGLNFQSQNKSRVRQPCPRFLLLIETPTKGLQTKSHEWPKNGVCEGRPCLRTAFPWCSRTIHSTRVQPLRRHPVASFGRNSGIRHQSAVSRDHSSRMGLLKLRIAACHGWCSNRPLKSGTG